MYEVIIDRSECKGCGACERNSQIFFMDSDDFLVNMDGGYIDDEEQTLEALVENLYEIKIPASICPKNCFKVYDEDTGDEIEIERRSTI